MARRDRAGCGVTERIKAQMREVVRVVEVEGVNGGVHLVHVLDCGCWVIRGNGRGRPSKRMQCIACELRPEGLKLRIAIPTAMYLVRTAVDAALGEVARQCGALGTTLVEARGVGISAADCIARSFEGKPAPTAYEESERTE